MKRVAERAQRGPSWASVPVGVGEPVPAVVAATAERPAFTARPLPASLANPCGEAGMGVTIGRGGCAGSAP